MKAPKKASCPDEHNKHQMHLGTHGHHPEAQHVALKHGHQNHTESQIQKTITNTPQRAYTQHSLPNQPYEPNNPQDTGIINQKKPGPNRTNPGRPNRPTEDNEQAIPLILFQKGTGPAQTQHSRPKGTRCSRQTQKAYTRMHPRLPTTILPAHVHRKGKTQP